MVVNIVCTQFTSHIDASAEMESETDLLTSTGTGFNASITRDKLDSTVQLPNFRLVMA